jgi:putative hemolysin
VGEIQDEYDQAEESPYQELGSGEYIFQGRVDLDDFNEIMGSYLPHEEADTIGGFIYNRIGRVPSNGESLEIDHLVLTVEQVSGRRIRKVRAYWAPAGEEEEKEESDVNR